MSKVFIIQNIIPNYREPVFRKISALENIDLTVFYSSLAKQAVKDSFKQKKEFIGFKAIEIPKIVIRNKIYQFSILRKIINNRPNIVIAQGFGRLDMIIALSLCKILKINFFWWNGGTPYIDKDEPLNGVIAKVFRNNDPRIILSKKANGMLVYSDHAKSYFEKKGFKNIIIVAPNSPDTDYFLRFKKYFSENPQIIEEFKRKYAPKKEKIILMIGRLDTTRKTDDLLKAFSCLQKEIPDICLIIIGDGSERSKNEELTLSLKLKNVYFEGEIYDDEILSKYYFISDLFITPGVASLAIKIAMTFAKPVITVDYGLEVHSVKNDFNGFIVPINNYKELYKSAKGLLRDEVLYNIISKNAELTIVNNININKMVNAFKEAALYTNDKRN